MVFLLCCCCCFETRFITICFPRSGNFFALLQGGHRIQRYHRCSRRCRSHQQISPSTLCPRSFNDFVVWDTFPHRRFPLLSQLPGIPCTVYLGVDFVHHRFCTRHVLHLADNRAFLPAYNPRSAGLPRHV